MKSVYLQKDKSIFKLNELPADKFAASLGVAGMTNIKFLRKEAAKDKKNTPRVMGPVDTDEAEIETSDGDANDNSGEDEDAKATAKVTA